ncbi:flagellum site-determining protein YlxH [Lederbergia ruris]|uniref:Flagellum site-determining protein YlxH n=1 Tax=Lederbergia ruris TaxID=217495 RepID=A0ABQ4KK00_9BACI|nr:MinD/ParA family protein [Lederbergia ruris]GIN57811.1 flagellum site-determining protein YlxH [Lederbergia ruris]
MNDQAQELRRMIQNNSTSQAKTLAVVSGKGGVGKSNISINMATQLNERGYKVLLFDLDLGMGNVNIILGHSSAYTLSDFLYKDLSIDNIIYRTSAGVSYISAGNGLNEAIELNASMLSKLLTGLHAIQLQYDYIIFDMAAGANSATMKILLAADDIFVISTPEPTAMTDAYSMMKFICMEGTESEFFLICNRADNERQGRETLERLRKTTLKFLHKEVRLLGVLPEDSHVRKAVISQTAFSSKFPRASISIKLDLLLDRYLNDQNKPMTKQHMPSSFVGKLRKFFSQKD